MKFLIFMANNGLWGILPPEEYFMIKYSVKCFKSGVFPFTGQFFWAEYQFGSSISIQTGRGWKNSNFRVDYRGRNRLKFSGRFQNRIFQIYNIWVLNWIFMLIHSLYRSIDLDVSHRRAILVGISGRDFGKFIHPLAFWLLLNWNA